MSIRLPLTTVLDFDDAGNVGAGSVAGGVAKEFTLPQDTDNVVVKLTASIVGGGVTAALQTTDDGGTTWYDVARTSIVSNANATTAEWISGKTTTNEGYIGRAGASTLAGGGETGLPLMNPKARVFLQYSAGVSANALSRVKVLVNNQSATA